ncbi:MAG: sulfite exporter TauE/SafE family protein [Bacillota bacterium]|nr:sulfite exporter TauE/SafE family protein [Bacillota bacterium]
MILYILIVEFRKQVLMPVFFIFDFYIKYVVLANTSNMEKRKLVWMKLIFIGIVSGAVNGFFGGGAGLILVPLLKRVADLEIKKAHATAIAVTFLLSIVSAVPYVMNGAACINDAWTFMAAGAIGGAAGAFFLRKIPKRILHYAFAAFLIFSSIRMFCHG